MPQKNNQVLSVAEMQAAEQSLIEQGVSVEALMQRAGEGAADIIWRIAAGRSVTVLCGPGNNGGDGYVIAQALYARGISTIVVAPLVPRTPAAQAACRRYKGQIISGSDGVSGSDGIGGSVFVDCLFGSGLKRPLSAQFADLAAGLCMRHDRAVAVDLPSGVEADSGMCVDSMPVFDTTIALGAWKYAHFAGRAASNMGRLHLVDIGVENRSGGSFHISRPRLRKPWQYGHKYSRGLLGVIGGEMPGASLIAARSAMHAGAGYVKLLIAQVPSMIPPSLVVDTQAIEVALEDPRFDALLIGPGLGLGDEARTRLKLALELQLPTILDADALHLLNRETLAQTDPELLVATPHEGELNALCETFGIPASGARHQRASALHAATGMTIIAKGPSTSVHGEGEMHGRTVLTGLFTPGPSWLSVAGSGDVLAGITASRLSVGEDPFDAAIQAVWLHKQAAKLAGPAFSADGLSARIAESYATFL